MPAPMLPANAERGPSPAAPIVSLCSRLLEKRSLLVIGILVRLVTFAFLDPANVDDHSLVLEFIVKQGRLPHSGELGQAYHPPLYYLLASPILRGSGSLKVVQVLSLVFSVLTLFLLYRLIYHTGLIASSRARLYSFLLVCFLPQFVMYTLFVSNDTLMILLGCGIAWFVYQYVHLPHGKNLTKLALATTFGLLTKITTLAYLPALFLTIVFVTFQRRHSLARAVALAAAVLFAVVLGGSYKLVDNYRYYHQPLITNIDFHPVWAAKQAEFYRGLASYVTFDLPYLVAHPTLTATTESSYPLFLYATFWYQHAPESNFIGASHKPFSYIGSATYVFATLPSATLLLGIFLLALRFPRSLCSFDYSRYEDRQRLVLYAMAGLFLGNLGLLVAAVAKYHVCSIMQGRLLFPSIFGGLAAFSVGVDKLDRSRSGSLVLRVCMMSLAALFLLYLGGENVFLLLSRFLPGFKSVLKTWALK